MAIEFRCTQCNRLLRTGDETAGRDAQCPECGAISAIPASTAPSEPPPPAGPEGGNPFAVWQAPEAQPPSDNPYQSPVSSLYLAPGRADPFAKQRVAGPATALIVTAVLGLIGNVLSLAFIGFVLSQRPALPPNNNLDDFTGYMNLGVAFIGLPVGVVMLIGAMKMKKLESYGLAMAGAILGMIPYLSPCCLLGLPFGIWALVVLSDGSVKAAFRNRSG
jgi:phage FluMu protein Com